MNLREETFYKIAEREIRRILLAASVPPEKSRRYNHEEVALAKSCQQEEITYEEFVKRRIAYENKIRNHTKLLKVKK